MSFSALRSEISSRQGELQIFFRLISRNEEKIPVPIEHTTLKGHFVISIYALLEYAVVRTVDTAINFINKFEMKHKHADLSVITLLEHSRFTSESTVSGEKKWMKRHEIIHSCQEDRVCKIDSGALHDQTQNVGVNTIDLLFMLFSVQARPVVSGIAGGYITEIKNGRNAVAHGRESASAVGGRFSSGNLERRMLVIIDQVDHIINSFELMTKKKAFIKAPYRRLYH